MQQDAFGFRPLPQCHISSKYIKYFLRRTLLANSSTDDAVYYEQPTGAKIFRDCFQLSASIVEFVFS